MLGTMACESGQMVSRREGAPQFGHSIGQRAQAQVRRKARAPLTRARP